jgi:protein involved in polysaccharide export with SLBB domain
MRMRLYALLVVLYLASARTGISQSANGNQSVDCADPLLASASSGCDQYLQGGQSVSYGQYDQASQYQIRSANGFNGSTATTPNAQSLTSGASESDPLRSGYANAQRERLLPAELPTEFQKFVAATTGQLLPVYGANFFRNVPSTFSPNDLAPVTPDYVIGPDDELRIRIWGQVGYSGNLRVDRSGNIYLPQVGEIHVAGLSFSDLDLHVRQAVSRVYRNFDLSVDMGRIRSIQVYVTGRARRPGAYTVSSLSSLVNVLFASGGPSLEGSLRHILLNRNGKTITDFDLYALVIRGDKSKDVRLLPEDVLYIPPVGPQVAVTGSVHEPGIYELLGNESIADVLKNAGEMSTLASNSRISLDRVDQHQYRQAMEIAVDAESLKTQLVDGDILRVFSILPAYQKTVTLRGNVANPGRFGWHSGMRLSDLIPDRDSLVTRDYWWQRSHLGLAVPEFESVISTIGRDPRSPETTIRGFTSSVSSETLSSALTARAQDNVDRSNLRSQAGEIRDSGNNSSLGAQVAASTTPRGRGESARNDVFLAAPEINWNYAVIERIDPDTLKASLIPFDLGKLVLKHDASEDRILQPGDTVTIFSQADISVPQADRTKYVRLDGEFVHAGIYSVQPGETLRDIVKRAGGFSQKAFLYGSEFTRESTRKLQQQRIDEYVDAVSAEAERGTQALAVSGSSGGASASNVSASREVGQQLISRLRQIRATGRIVLQLRPESRSIEDIPNLSLENGDRFAVPSVPDTINVVGAVYDQNSFLYVSRRTLGHYLKLAGGPTRNADSRHAFLIRADGSVISKTTANNGWNSWTGNGFNEIRVNPGDTIVIPDKTLRPTALRNLLDWTQVFSQLSFGAAAINVIR